MNVALLGTGLMGCPMAEKLLEAGHQVTVFNRTAQKTEPLRKKGANIALTPQEAVRSCECTILMLSDATAINEMLFSSPIDFKDKVIIQMGTIAPQESVNFNKLINEAGGQYFECPVLGSKAQASSATLILMVGSSKDQYEEWKDFLKSFGPKPVRVGEVPSAAALKLAMNQLIASLACTFSVSLGLVQHNGVDVDQFMDILKNSTLYAPMFEKKLPNMINRDYANPNFPVKHLLKDVNLILSESSASGLDVSHLEGVRAILEKTIEKNLEDSDYSALFETVNPKG